MVACLPRITTASLPVFVSLCPSLDLLAILPFYAAIALPNTWLDNYSDMFRLFRLLRIVKLDKYIPSITLIDDVLQLKNKSLTVAGFAAGTTTTYWAGATEHSLGDWHARRRLIYGRLAVNKRRNKNIERKVSFPLEHMLCTHLYTTLSQNETSVCNPLRALFLFQTRITIPPCRMANPTRVNASNSACIRLKPRATLELNLSSQSLKTVDVIRTREGHSPEYYVQFVHLGFCILESR